VEFSSLSNEVCAHHFSVAILIARKPLIFSISKTMTVVFAQRLKQNSFSITFYRIPHCLKAFV